MDRRSKKWSQKGYHSLPFAVKVSVRRSFEQFHTLNDWQKSFRVIQFLPCNQTCHFYKIKGFLTACWNTAAYCISLPFGTPDSGSKFRRNQVFIRYHGASAGLPKGNRLSKRKRNVLRCFKVMQNLRGKIRCIMGDRGKWRIQLFWPSKFGQ